ncbi:MAG: DUF192 domain-containing protein [Candidatus Omnitrophota bacterium]
MPKIRIPIAVFLVSSAMLLPSQCFPDELPVVKLLAGGKELKAEIARTPSQRETGLMCRRVLGEGEGMLFLFEEPERAALYMKETHIPLSCAFIDSGGVILEIRDMEPLDETPVTSVSSRIRFALEVNRGWFKRNKIGPGMPVRTEKGDLLSLF